MLRDACRQLESWRRDDLVRDDLTISINISPRQFTSPALAGEVAKVLDETGLPAANLRLDVKEAALMASDDAVERLRELAQEIARAQAVIYIGRGMGYPIALEGALKLKEISYIHAEGFAAGELKHGPIALIDEGVPVIVIAPSDALFEKTASNMQEVIARGARVVFLSDAKGVETLGALAAATIELPSVDPFVAPVLYAIPVQLLAYHVAVIKGTDVDQPRNLAKSVTVEIGRAHV